MVCLVNDSYIRAARDSFFREVPHLHSLGVCSPELVDSWRVDGG